MADRSESRIPPHNLNAEKSVLGAMMLDPATAVHVARLVPEDFYYPANAQIFSSMLELAKTNKPVDLLTVHDLLDKRGVLESLGGLDYLVELNNFVPSAVNVEHYVAMVIERSLLRQLIRVAGKLADDSYEGAREPMAILNDAEKEIFKLSQRGIKRELMQMSQAVKEIYARAEFLLENPEVELGLPTGYPTLDHKLGGMLPSQLILIAARPSMGKSAFAMNIAQYIATYRQKVAVVFSLEMPYDQLAQRVLSTGSKVPLSKIKGGGLQPEEWVKMANAVTEMESTSILVDDTPSITVMEMLSKCRQVKMNGGLDIVVIDYLQLISSGGDSKQRENRQQEISEMTRSLKLMARELNVPILLLSQLSRAAEKRESHRPVLADLRESGAIEQDADIVMFIYRDAYYKKYEGGSEAEIIVAKNRNGATGTATIAWNEELASFQNIENY
jgi:replicative DNA helicase